MDKKRKECIAKLNIGIDKDAWRNIGGLLMEQLSLAGLGFEMSADEDKKGSGVSPDLGETISGSKAMQMLELSRHTFEKVEKQEQ